MAFDYEEVAEMLRANEAFAVLGGRTKESALSETFATVYSQGVREGMLAVLDGAELAAVGRFVAALHEIAQGTDAGAAIARKAIGSQ